MSSPTSSEAVLAAAPAMGSPGLNISLFAVFIVATLLVVRRTSTMTSSAADYYAAGRSFTGPQNGLALTGDFLSAATILGISGSIAVYGYDGFLYFTGALVGWLGALLLAEPMRNIGRFTMGDVLAFRMRQRPVRAAAAVSTLVVALFYLFAQMAGAGGLVALLGNITDPVGQAAVIAVVGLIMIFYVLVGGMRGTTWVQIIKATLLLLTTAVLLAWSLGRVGFNFLHVLSAAVDRSPHGEAILAPGLQYGSSSTSELDFLSQALAFILGTAALPHVLMRYYTVPDAAQARRSVSWAIWLIGACWLGVTVIGYEAAALVDPAVIAAAPGKSNSATPLLAFRLGGEVLLALVSAVAFATILAVVAGLTITASTSLAHDVYATILKRGRPAPGREVRVARLCALGIGVLGVAGGILANGQNILFLVSLTFAVAASANLPAILYSLLWKRFSTAGALASIYGGLASSVVLIVFSPSMSGGPEPMIKGVDFHWFPLTNPGVVSIPLSFVLGAVFSVLFPEERSRTRHDEIQVRALAADPTASDEPSPAQSAEPAPEPGIRSDGAAGRHAGAGAQAVPQTAGISTPTHAGPPLPTRTAPSPRPRV